MKPYWKMYIPVVMLLAVINGCATCGGDSDTADAESEAVACEADAPVLLLPPQVPALLNDVAFLDNGLVKKIMVQRTIYERTPTGTIEVMCSFKNMTNKDLRIQARTQFFDADRFHQEGPDAWQMVFLPAQGIETYTSRSYGTGRNLAYYYIEVAKLDD